MTEGMWFDIVILTLILVTFVLGKCERNSLHTVKKASVRLDSEKAKSMTEQSVTQEKVDKILKPVLKNIYKRASLGYSETEVYGHKLYYCEDATTKEAKRQLECLGYHLFHSNRQVAIVIRW